MAASGDLYTEVEKLKALAIDPFTEIENDNDLGEVATALNILIERAIVVRDVVEAVNTNLTGL